jgi:GT2 family glycosyltransferase
MSVVETTQDLALKLAVIAIGRNEGERLRRCLESLAGQAELVVYVDSGSTDGSVEMARQQGAEVVCLDMGQPFTAARARNAGWRRALERLPGVQFVQFVDGDCEVVPGWIASARRQLVDKPAIAAVFGRRRERFPERSVYNRLCDIEWDVAPGQVKYCGGDVMFLADALAQVGGYREDLIAGEEPELCVRLRALGWTIHCLPLEMTIHDAAITRFSQWWRRTMRSGYAYAQGARLHGAPPERHWVRPLRSALVWAVAFPAAIALAALVLGPRASVLGLIYPLQVLRLAVKTPGNVRLRLSRAFYLVLAKFPEAQGALRHFRHAVLHRRGELIEYK